MLSGLAHEGVGSVDCSDDGKGRDRGRWHTLVEGYDVDFDGTGSIKEK